MVDPTAARANADLHPGCLEIAVGLAFTAAGLWQLVVNGTGDLLGLLTLAAVVIGLALVWRVLGFDGG